MKAPTSPSAFIEQSPLEWQSTLTKMREFLLTTDLEESIKWMIPVYSFGKKNVVGLIHTKGYTGAWFFQGVFLTDPDNVLVNAKEDVTVAQRQLRFTSPEKVDLKLFKEFTYQAIQNQLDGLEIKPTPKPKLVIPAELQAALDKDSSLASAFSSFAPYKQREFCNALTSVKREATKKAKLKKIIGMIRDGLSFSDLYRK